MPRSDQNTKVVTKSLLAGAVALAACGPASTLPPGTQDPLTYERDVKPIVEQSCTGCHVAGGIGPFALTSYADVKTHRFAIASVTEARTMPPVLAAKGCNDY